MPVFSLMITGRIPRKLLFLRSLPDIDFSRLIAPLMTVCYQDLSRRTSQVKRLCHRRDAGVSLRRSQNASLGMANYLLWSATKPFFDMNCVKNWLDAYAAAERITTNQRIALYTAIKPPEESTLRTV